MSRIDEMIRELCPEGVDYIKIKDAFVRLKGTPITAGVMKEIENRDGDVIIFAGGKTIIKAFEKDIPNANIANVPAVIVQSRGVIDVQYCASPFTFKNEMWAYTCNETTTIKYLYYYLKQNIETLRRKGSEHGSMPQISLSATEDYVIPLPPLPIQQKIVSVLDSFTTLIDRMKSEVEKRKKQMEYYREKLICEPNYLKKAIGEIGTIKRGSGLQKTDFTEYGVGCIHYGQIYTRLNSFCTETLTYVPSELAKKLTTVSHGDLVIATTSENVEDVCKSVVWLGKEDICTGGHAAVFKHKENPKYISYCFQTGDFFLQKRQYAYGAKVIDIKTEKLNAITLPIPSIDKQEEIVSTLDKFETYITKLETLIALRQKQYEYYREKLLTFE